MPQSEDQNPRVTLNWKTLGGLSELQVKGEPAVLPKLIELFLSTSNVKIKEIQEKITLADLEKAKQDAHNLKSSALTMGAEKLGDYCGQLEEVAELSQAKDLADKIHHEHKKVVLAIEKYQSKFVA